jgi:hypothetical protein
VNHLGKLLIICLLVSCERYEEDAPFVEWKIPKGKHGQSLRFTELSDDFLSYDVIFDSSAIYRNIDPVNQYDINKLFGFSDCDAFHHVNSARFGWRWGTDTDSTGLLVYAYNYVNESRNIRYLGQVELMKPYRYYLILEEENYLFYIEGITDEIVSMPRGEGCERGLYYLLFPYFGGDEVAPQDITIYWKRNLTDRL